MNFLVSDGVKQLQKMSVILCIQTQYCLVASSLSIRCMALRYILQITMINMRLANRSRSRKYMEKCSECIVKYIDMMTWKMKNDTIIVFRNNNRFAMAISRCPKYCFFEIFAALNTALHPQYAYIM